MNEKHIKAVILTLLYQSEIYFIRSEAEVNNRYPDILLLERSPFEVPNQFLFELKYCKKRDGAQRRQQKKEEGIRQVQEYLELEDVRCPDKLRAYLLLTDGSEVEAVELNSPVLVAERRKRLTKSDSIRFLELLRELSLEVIQEAPQRGTSEIMVLAREQQLSSYDASYLDLAMRKGLPLATLDARLRNAAEKCGVAFFELPKTDKPE